MTGIVDLAIGPFSGRNADSRRSGQAMLDILPRFPASSNQTLQENGSRGRNFNDMQRRKAQRNRLERGAGDITHECATAAVVMHQTERQAVKQSVRRPCYRESTRVPRGLESLDVKAVVILEIAIGNTRDDTANKHDPIIVRIPRARDGKQTVLARPTGADHRHESTVVAVHHV